jgi:hypothetical protein
VAFAPPAPSPTSPTRPAANRSIDPFAPDPTPPPSLVSVPLAGAPLGPNSYVADILQGGMTVYNTGFRLGLRHSIPWKCACAPTAEASKELFWMGN